MRKLLEQKKQQAQKRAKNASNTTDTYNVAGLQSGLVHNSAAGLSTTNSATYPSATQSAQHAASELSGEDLINSQYDEQLAASQAQLEAELAKAKAEYDAQISNAPNTYDAIRDKAGVDKEMAERARRESMANMGLSGAGGMSQTLAQRGRNAYLGAVGDADRQQQDYVDNINMALANLQTQYGADVTSLEAENNASRNAELAQYRQWKDNYDLQQQQLEQSKQSSVFDQAYALLLKRKITKAQFEAMTGIDLR